MNPNRRNTDTSPAFSWIGKGILFGLAFFIPGILIMNDILSVEFKLNTSTSLPVISSISRDFETGVVAVGDVFQMKADKFYGIETSIKIQDYNKENKDSLKSNDRQSEPLTFVHNDKDSLIISNTDSIVYAAWSKETIQKKLTKKLGRKKMKDIQAYLSYIEKYKDLASKEMYYTKIPASIKLAQGLLESNAGKSYLARVCKNHFGIKCLPKKGFRSDGRITSGDFQHDRLAYNCKQVSDDHNWDRFEMYQSDEVSYHRHSDLILNNKRYNWMINKYRTGRNYSLEQQWFEKESVPYYAVWAVGLKKSGYATNKQYAQKLAYIIETYELWRIDYSVIFWS